MGSNGLKILIFLSYLFCFATYAQEKPDVVEGKDYNRNFYIKVVTGTGQTDWRLHFPENLVDTSGRLGLPPKNHLKFKSKGTEYYLGFSALFGLPWGKLGGGFLTSRLRMDSLREEVDGRVLNFSYHEETTGFHRFYAEYQTNPLSLDEKGEFYFIAGFIAGTYILFPIDQNILPRTNLFGMVEPGIEYRLERWFSVLLNAAYEFRYFNTKELFGSRELIYNNYINSFNIKLGMCFRIYHPDSKHITPPLERVK